MALPHALDGPATPVVWHELKQGDSHPEPASVTERAQPLSFAERPQTPTQARFGVKASSEGVWAFNRHQPAYSGLRAAATGAAEAHADGSAEAGDVSHFVRSSQETLHWGTHAVYLWCSVWIFNTTVLPMSFEDPNTGRLAMAVNSSAAVPKRSPSLFVLENEDEVKPAAWEQWFGGGTPPAAAGRSVESIKIALQSQTQWTDSLKIDTPGTTHDFFMDDVFAVGDRLQLSLSVDMVRPTRCGRFSCPFVCLHRSD